jgi:hypothetical protein
MTPTRRSGPTLVEFSNEGLVVFLYDEASAEAIRAASPTLLEGFGDDDASDPALARLATDGLLVAFELAQDDPVRIELRVGRQLTEAERADRWLAGHMRSRTASSSGSPAFPGRGSWL